MFVEHNFECSKCKANTVENPGDICSECSNSEQIIAEGIARKIQDYWRIRDKPPEIQETPVYIKRHYHSGKPRGYHIIKIWRSQMLTGKYSFAIAYGGGVMSSCDYEKDTDYTFGHFDSINLALEAAIKTISEQS